MENWVLLDLDPLAAARLGLPEQVFVPADIDSASATPADLIGYAAQFADAEPDHPLAAEHRRIAAKQRPMMLAQQALAEQRWDDALAQVDAVLVIDPQDAPARLNRAAALRETGEAQAALAELDAVARVFADVPLFHRNRARVLEDLGQDDRARGVVDRAGDDLVDVHEHRLHRPERRRARCVADVERCPTVRRELSEALLQCGEVGRTEPPPQPGRDPRPAGRPLGRTSTPPGGLPRAAARAGAVLLGRHAVALDLRDDARARC